MKHTRVFWSGVCALTLSLLLISIAQAQTPITPLFPQDNSSITNDQPLIAWTSSSQSNVSYRFELSQTNAFNSQSTHTANTNNAYYQIPVQQEPGTWHWRIHTLSSNETINTTSPTYKYTIITPPEFSIEPDTTNYHNNNRVDFLINAPLGSAVHLLITKQGFSLPFTTNNLQTNTFSTFLEPGTYSYEATFNYSEFFSTTQDSFTLETPIINDITLTINVTDEEKNPLQGVTITVEGELTYRGTTNNQGRWTQELPPGRYDILLTHPDYEYESFRRTFHEDASFSFALYPQEQLTIQEAAPQTRSTNQWSPTITITRPEYRATVEGTNMEVSFTIDNPQGIEGCDVLSQQQGAQGWSVVGFTSNISQENSIVINELPSAEHALKIKCAKGQEVSESSPRTIIVRNKPQNYEPLAQFFKELEATSYQSTNTPLFTTLNAAGNISKAKKVLSDLEERYKQADEEDQEQLAQQIDRLIESYASALVKSFRILSEEETVISPSAEDYQGEDKKRVAQEQQNYVFRTKTVVAHITTFDQTTSYLTALSFTPQSMTGSTEEFIVHYSFPEVYFQRIGTPDLLDEEGKPTGTYEDDLFVITTRPSNPFVVLFKGDVTSSLPSHPVLTIIPLPSENIVEEEESSGFSMITGRVVDTIEQTGINTTLLSLILVSALIVIIVLRNPLYNISDYRMDARVKKITEDVHTVMDLFQNRQHQQAFTKYPRLFNLYEQLPSNHQQHLAFAMNHLTLELETYPVRQELAKARVALTTNPSLLGSLIQSITTQYSQLSPRAQSAVLPLIRDLQSSLRR